MAYEQHRTMEFDSLNVTPTGVKVKIKFPKLQNDQREGHYWDYSYKEVPIEDVSFLQTQITAAIENVGKSIDRYRKPDPGVTAWRDR